MNYLDIDNTSNKTIIKSFERIAKIIFEDLQLQVNKSYYRFLDIEFYYFAPNVFEDVYAHKHEIQLQPEKWYFHGSGIDITFGKDGNYGGILIRAIAKISKDATREKKFILKDFHGPLKVKTEICSNLNNVFDNKPNIFQLNYNSDDRLMALMKEPTHIIHTKRIGLNPEKDYSTEKDFYNGKFRFVIFPHLGLKDKTTIAFDMQSQFPNLSKNEINKLFGSTFLK